MREIVRAGMTLRKIQPGVCRLQWMGQQPPIESRGTRSFTAYTVERRVFAPAGSFPSMSKDLKSIAQQAEKQKNSKHQTMVQGEAGPTWRAHYVRQDFPSWAKTTFRSHNREPRPCAAGRKSRGAISNGTVNF